MTAPSPAVSTPNEPAPQPEAAGAAVVSGSTAPIIEIKDLSFGYGGDTDDGASPTVVLSALDLKLAVGGFLAIVGPSGVGKSSLLRVIAGLSSPLEGSVRVAAAESPGRRPTAMVFQEPRLLPWRRILGNVEFGLEGLLPTAQGRRERAARALALVGLAGHEGKWPRQLSGGQRQRVGLARALAVEPALLLMDEPFSALDTITRQILQDELIRIWDTTRTSILLVTHDLDEAVYLADRVLLLDGKPARVTQDLAITLPRPRHREAKAFGDNVRAIRDAMSAGYQDGDGI